MAVESLLLECPGKVCSRHPEGGVLGSPHPAFVVTHREKKGWKKEDVAMIVHCDVKIFCADNVPVCNVVHQSATIPSCCIVVASVAGCAAYGIHLFGIRTNIVHLKKKKKKQLVLADDLRKLTRSAVAGASARRWTRTPPRRGRGYTVLQHPIHRAAHAGVLSCCRRRRRSPFFFSRSFQLIGAADWLTWRKSRISSRS